VAQQILSVKAIPKGEKSRDCFSTLLNLDLTTKPSLEINNIQIAGNAKFVKLVCF